MSRPRCPTQNTRQAVQILLATCPRPRPILQGSPRLSQCIQSSSRWRSLSFSKTDACIEHQRLWPTRPGRNTVPAQCGRRFSSFHGDDATIYALSSAPGKAGIAVIRVSGSACLDIYKGLCPTAPSLKPRYAAVRTLYGPGTVSLDSQEEANVLDAHAVVLYFPGPKTVTGEDVLELHVHGGPATVKAVLGAIPECNRFRGGRSRLGHVIRYAEPGEFTRRAFFNGRIDLAQVESLGDTLDAETEHQRRAAVRGSSGQLGATYERWRQQLLGARAEIEALIDFSEDQHFDESPQELLSNVSRQVVSLLQSLSVHEAAADRNSLLRHGIRIALVGPANAGKSSLMNLVVGREASIVSQEAGTTRDIVEASLDLRGYLCTFADTAGFRGGGRDVGEKGRKDDNYDNYDGSKESQEKTGLLPVGSIEAEGIRRARQKAADSDIVVVLASVARVNQDQQGLGGDTNTDSRGRSHDNSRHATSAADTDTPGHPVSSPTSSTFHYYVRFDAETLRLAAQARQRLVVLNKCDLVLDDVTTGGAAALAALVEGFRTSSLGGLPLVTVSCKVAEDAAGTAAPVVGSRGRGSVGVADRTSGIGSGGGGGVSTATTTARNSAFSIHSHSDPGGIRRLVDSLAKAFSSMTDLPSDSPQHLLGVTARQQQLLAQCRTHLEDFLVEAGAEDPENLEDLEDPEGLKNLKNLKGAEALGGHLESADRDLQQPLLQQGLGPRHDAGADRAPSNITGCQTAVENTPSDGLFIGQHNEHSRDADIVLAAEHLRYAADCLARITGRGEAGDIEEVLGVIFEK